MAEKIIMICDVTGEEGARTLVYPTGETTTTDQSGSREYKYLKVDLSHAGAMVLLSEIAAYLESNGAILSAHDLSELVNNLKARYERLSAKGKV